MDREKKDQILRGVYEENKRINERSFSTSRTTRRKAAAGIGGLLFVLALLAMTVRVLNTDSKPIIGERGQPSERLQIPVPHDSLSPAPPVGMGDFSGIGVPLMDLFDLGVRTIVIDPGHGGRDPGASGLGGLHEKEITLDVARRLQRRLVEQHGLTVVLTRGADSTLSLRERVELTNLQNPDLFISIHVNYFPSEPVYALETYYFGTGSDESAIQRAQRENENSDYSVAEFNRLMQTFGSRVKLDESHRLARSVQQSIFRNTRLLNSEVRNWGTKSAPFVVLVGVDAPGILAEIGVISNRDEEQRLATPEYREQLALFMEEGIVNYLASLDSSATTDQEN